MKFFLSVKASAKQNKVERIDEAHLKISVKAAPKEGEANEAVVEVLSEYFKVPKRSIEILSGHKSKNKVIQIPS